MAKRNTLKFDTTAFMEYAQKLEALGAELKPVFTDALEQAGETIAADTHDALADEHLPAGGKYRKEPSKTDRSVVDHPKVEWSGSVGSIGVGFDYAKPGAGGFLITGTPRMRPDQELKRMYKGKKYMAGITDDINDVLQNAIRKRVGG